MDRMGHCEGDDADKALLHCTGADQESWFWNWSSCEDLCFDAMVQACIDVSNSESMIEVVKDKMKVATALQTSREQEIRTRLEKEQEQSN